MTDAVARACRLAKDRDVAADPLTVVVATIGDVLGGDAKPCCELATPSNKDDDDDEDGAADKHVGGAKLEICC
jgi:hypothetical protein